MEQGVGGWANPYLAKFAMPLANRLLEVAPLDQVFRSNDLFGCPTKLKSGQEGNRSTTLRTILLHEQLLILVPLLDVGQNTEQETTCWLSEMGNTLVSDSVTYRSCAPRIRCKKR